MKYGIGETSNGGSNLYQYLATFLGSLAILTTGMHYGWPSPSLPKLQSANSTLPITDDEGSWIAVMPLLGGPIGSIISCSIIDIIGRKKTIVMTAIPFFAAWIMVAYANCISMLYIARFIAGISDGLSYSPLVLYVGEIADAKIRGLLGTCISSIWIFGMLFINIIGSYHSIRTTAFIASIFPVTMMLTFSWMPESPYFLLMRGQRQEARNSLRKFKGTLNVEQELTRLDVAIATQMEHCSIWDVFTIKSNRKALFISVIVTAIQQLSGQPAINFNNHDIFLEADRNFSSDLASIIYFSIQFSLVSLCSSLVDKLGRKPLIILSLLGAAVALFVEGTYFYIKTNTNIDTTYIVYLPIFALLSYVAAYSIGLQIVPNILLSELFPANVKAVASCLTDFSLCISAALVSKYFQILKDNVGMDIPFYIFAVFCLAGLVIIILIVPETKGLTLEEIQEIFRKGTPKNINHNG